MPIRVAQRKTGGAGGGVGQRFVAPSATSDGIGEGLQNFGKSLAVVAERQDRMDAEFDDTMSRRVALDYQKRASELRSEFENTSGINAVNGRADTEAALKKIYDQNLQQATNPRMAAMLRERLDGFYTADTIKVGSHAVKELKIETSNTLKVQAEQSRDMVAENWDDPILSAKHLETGLSAIDKLGAHEGWSDDVTAFERDKFASGAHRQTIDNMLRNEDYEAAETYLEAHSGEILYTDEQKLRDDIQPGLQRREARDDFIRATGMVPPSSGGGDPFTYALPVKGRETSQFHAQRGSKLHNGLDVAAPVGTAIRPMAPGKVKQVGYDEKSGNFIIIQHADGTTTSYSHMQGKPDLAVGAPVGESTRIGAIGLTGNTTGAHVHIVARRSGKEIDPKSLVGNGGNAPREWDKANVYDSIENLAAAEGWSEEKIERAKSYADREISRDEQLLARAERAADKEYSEFILANPDITTAVRVPRELRDRMSVDARASLQRTIEANRKDSEPKANGNIALTLGLMAIREPEKFAEMDLAPYVGQVTRAEITGFAKQQAKLNAPGGQKEVSMRGGISAAINFHASNDMGITGDDNREEFMKVHEIMRAELEGVTGGKRSPTDREYEQAFASATRTVKQKYDVKIPLIGVKIYSTEKEKPRNELGIGDVPASARKQIVAAWRAAGNAGEPDDEVIAERYRTYKGRLW